MKTPLEPYSVGPVEAARLMSISRSRVYQLKDAGELPWYKDGRRTMFLVSGIEARIARLMSAPPSTGPLLSSEERKLARQRATDPHPPPHPEEQRVAIERVDEPPPPVDQQPSVVGPEPPPAVEQWRPAGESEPLAPEPEPEPAPAGDEQPASEPPDHDYALVFAERFKLLIRNLGHDEGRLRSIEYTVRFYLSQNPSANLDQATKIVRAAIKQSSTKETAPQ